MTCIKNHLTSGQMSANFLNAQAKSGAEPRNSFDLLTANSTPNRAFFVRSTRTPQERPESLELHERHSMVACNGKGFALCSVPLVGVFEPVTRYRPSLETLAVTLKKLTSGVPKMLFKFLLLGDKRLTVRIRANSEQEARQRLNLQSPALCVARFRTKGGNNG